jgi:hypothetical protein
MPFVMISGNVFKNLTCPVVSAMLESLPKITVSLSMPCFIGFEPVSENLFSLEFPGAICRHVLGIGTAFLCVSIAGAREMSG